MTWLAGLLGLGLFATVLCELNGPCSTHHDCNNPAVPDSTPFSYCNDGRCECHPWFFQLGTTCVRASHGFPCAEFGVNRDEFCRLGVGDGSFCDTVTGRCKCQVGHVERVNHCGATWCDSIGEGSECSPGPDGDDQCRSHLNDQTATCHTDSMVCLCGAGKQYIKSRKRCVSVLPAPVRDGICSACIQTGGLCYSTSVGLGAYQCECPPCKQTTPTQDWREVGCDDLFADLGEACSVKRNIRCRDAHATCTHAPTLDNIDYCQCLPGYVPVCDTLNDPKFRRCVKVVSRKEDRNCEQCWARGGQCYQDTSDPKIPIGIGCVCPSHLTTSNPLEPSTFCDTEIVNVACSDESMRICYDPSKHSRYPNITSDLMTRKGRLYIEHHDHDVQCHFQFDSVDNKWCIDLDLRQKGRCGLETSRPTGSTISYTSNIVLQRQRFKMTVNDFCVLVYCVFDTTVHVHNGYVVGKKYRFSHGLEISPVVVMRIEDEFMKMPSRQVVVGEKIRLCIEMTEDRNTYDAIQALVCVASNSRYLYIMRDTLSCLLIDDACVVQNPYLTHLDNFKPLPTDRNHICTGFFPAFRFVDQDKVFFHCAVKTCRNADDCRPKTCTTINRDRRAITEDEDFVMNANNVDMDGGMIKWKRAVNADKLAEAQKLFEDPELSHQVVGIRVVDPKDKSEEIQEEEELLLDEMAGVRMDSYKGRSVIEDGKPVDRIVMERSAEKGEPDDLALLGRSGIVLIVVVIVIILTFILAACIYYHFCTSVHPGESSYGR